MSRGRWRRRCGSTQQTSGFVRVTAVHMATNNQLTLLPVPCAQPVLITVARDDAFHAWRSFVGHRTRHRRRDEAVVHTAIAVLRH